MSKKELPNWELMKIGMILSGAFGLIFIVLPSFLLNYVVTPDQWCSMAKPQFNLSDNPKVSYCFNEGWSDYCKISYPMHCPNNAYSDFDRCMNNCKVYGLSKEKCPCVEV